MIFFYQLLICLIILFFSIASAYAEDRPNHVPKDFYLGPCGTLIDSSSVRQLGQILKDPVVVEKLRLLPNGVKFTYHADYGWVLLNFPEKDTQEIILSKGISHHTNHYYTFTKYVGKTRYYQNAMIQFSSLNLPFNGSWSWQKDRQVRVEQIIRGKIRLSVFRFVDSKPVNFANEIHEYVIDDQEISKLDSWMFNPNKIPNDFRKGYLCGSSQPRDILDFFDNLLDAKKKVK